MKNKDPLLKMDFGKEEAKHEPKKPNYIKLVAYIIVVITITVLIILWLVKQMSQIGTILTSNNEYRKMKEMFYPMNSTFLNVNF